MEDSDLKDLKGFKRKIAAYDLQCSFSKGAVHINVSTKNIPDKIYIGTYSNDTIPESLKLLFETAEDLYEYLVEPTCDGRIEIDNPSALTIYYKVGPRLRSTLIYLGEKELTVEEKLTRRIKELETEIAEGRGGSESGEAIILRRELQAKERQISFLNLQIKQLRKRNSEMIDEMSFIKREPEKLDIVKGEIQSLKKQNQNLSAKSNTLVAENERLNNLVHALESQVQSLNFIITDYENQLNRSQNLVKDLTNGINPEKKISNVEKQNQQGIYGKLLVYRPMTNSTNYKYYDFVNNVLTKNNDSATGTGKLIPCAVAIPKVGRFCYKILNKHSKNLPNFRLGVVTSKINLANESYMNGGDVDAVMYYCYSTDKEIIYEGNQKMEGFNIYKNNVLIMVIDQNTKTIEWYIENDLKKVTKFTESMKKSEGLYMFVQLWANGDSLQMIDK